MTVMRPLILLLALVTIATSTARASEFRIRRAAVRANGDVQLYHEPSPEAQPGDVAQATLGGRPCVAVPDVGTATDELAVVVVLDRGGSDRAGMRPYGNAMRAAVKQFIQTSLQRRPAMTFALVDAAGPRVPPAPTCMARHSGGSVCSRRRPARCGWPSSSPTASIRWTRPKRTGRRTARSWTLRGAPPRRSPRSTSTARRSLKPPRFRASSPAGPDFSRSFRTQGQSGARSMCRRSGPSEGASTTRC